MKIRELMSAPVHTCRPQDSLEHAAQLLWDHDCGMLPVVDGQGRVGAAITDRDICMGAYTRGGRLADLRVADSMSSGIATCRTDDDVATVAQRMAEHHVRRLPVVDADGRALGVISLNDLALAGEANPSIGREAARVLTAACRHQASAQTRAEPSAGAAERRVAGRSGAAARS